MKSLNYLFLTLVLLAGFSACKTIDLRTDYALNSATESDEAKGRRLLEATYRKMGYDKFAQTETYQVNSFFKWRMPWTMMPMNALPGNKSNAIRFNFATNTFDGQVEYLEGGRMGKTFGLQSWATYVIDEDGEVKAKERKRENWGLATYHYVIEAPMRLLKAEIVRYAGTREWNGQTYDLVYATWGQDDPHQEHDQWLVYINQATGMTDLTEITINDFFLPMPAGMKGATIQTERSLTSNGSYLPSLVTIQLRDPKPVEKNVYTFSLTEYRFDVFPTEKLYPLPGIAPIGDHKPTDTK